MVTFGTGKTESTKNNSKNISAETLWSLLSLENQSQHFFSTCALWSLLSLKNQSQKEIISAWSLWSLLSLKKERQGKKSAQAIFSSILVTLGSKNLSHKNKNMKWFYSNDLVTLVTFTQPHRECLRFFYHDECGLWCPGYGHVTHNLEAIVVKLRGYRRGGQYWHFPRENRPYLRLEMHWYSGALLR